MRQHIQSLVSDGVSHDICQIIITTSHERKTIGTYLEKIGVKHVVEFGDDRILQKMSS